MNRSLLNFNNMYNSFIFITKSILDTFYTKKASVYRGRLTTELVRHDCNSICDLNPITRNLLRKAIWLSQIFIYCLQIVFVRKGVPTDTSGTPRFPSTKHFAFTPHPP